jgi:hypothetical protein
MTIKISLPVVMAVALLVGAGCKKSDPNPSGAPDQSGTTIAIGQGGLAPSNPNAVATYPDMVPQSGTKQLLQPFTVYQAPDTTSAVLTRVSVGQWINLKGSRGNWMMIEWPSGVGQMSPGWIEVRSPSDSRLSQSPPVNPVVTTPPPPPVVVDAGAAPPPVATATVGKPGGRGIVLKPRHR